MVYLAFVIFELDLASYLLFDLDEEAFIFYLFLFFHLIIMSPKILLILALLIFNSSVNSALQINAMQRPKLSVRII